MSRKERDWIKASFDVKLPYQPYLIHIENGRIYNNFGLEISNNRKKLYYLPNGLYLGVYNDWTLKEIKELINLILICKINWIKQDN